METLKEARLRQAIDALEAVRSETAGHVGEPGLGGMAGRLQSASDYLADLADEAERAVRWLERMGARPIAARLEGGGAEALFAADDELVAGGVHAANGVDEAAASLDLELEHAAGPFEELAEALDGIARDLDGLASTASRDKEWLERQRGIVADVRGELR